MATGHGFEARIRPPFRGEDSPYRIRTNSSDVWASGIFLLQEMPSKAKKTIMGLQPAANQKGPATP